MDWSQVIEPPSRAHENNRGLELKLVPVLRWKKQTQSLRRGLKITNSVIIITVTLIKISPRTLEK